jgi:uncharacterized membrane protein YhdT
MSILDEYNIEVDPRFKQAHQEAKVVFVYMAIMGVSFFATFIWGYLSYDGDYNFILFMPTYMFITTIELIIFIIIGFIISIYYIEDASLEAWEN